MKSDQVSTIINEIRTKIEKNKIVTESDYTEFVKEYPNLYSMCLSKNFNKEQMNFFLTKLKQIENNEKTQHDASVDIGTQLVNKYVKSQIKE
jgi:type III secretory pathway component EscR